MIQIYYANTNIIQNANLDSIVSQLSSKNKTRLCSFRRKEDRELLLVSSILLVKLLEDSGNSDYKLSDIQYSAAGKPYFEGSNFDFNISHTDDCAVVAFAVNRRIGIDIEKIKDIDLSDFENILPINLWDQIHLSGNKIRTFYHYWTLLESALKADGGGLSLVSSGKVLIKNNCVILDGKHWFSEHMNFDPLFSCCLSSDKEIEAVNMIKIAAI